MKRLCIVMLFVLITPFALAQSKSQSMKEDVQHVQRWNKFFNSLLELHQQNMQHRKIETTEHLGGYAGQPNFYREVSYYDKASHRLLSRIQWETKHPRRAHTVEVFLYDDQGRVDRDYLAAYLPHFRNAPIQTLINLHHYNGDLHSYRQFDASGNLIYEHCERGKKNQNILIQLDEDDISFYHRGMMQNIDDKLYHKCFDGLEETATNYLNPF